MHKLLVHKGCGIYKSPDITRVNSTILPCCVDTTWASLTFPSVPDVYAYILLNRLQTKHNNKKCISILPEAAVAETSHFRYVSLCPQRLAALISVWGKVCSRVTIATLLPSSYLPLPIFTTLESQYTQKSLSWVQFNTPGVEIFLELPAFRSLIRVSVFSDSPMLIRKPFLVNFSGISDKSSVIALQAVTLKEKEWPERVHARSGVTVRLLAVANTM